MKNFFKELRAEAHCDIPCGVYEPTVAKIAARTVARMVDQITELAAPSDPHDGHAVAAFSNSISRRIAIKEQHAEACKHDLEVLWSDFFKPEHLEKFPKLHDIFWKAVKLCSKNKQDVSKESAADLLTAVDEIAHMFYEVKGDPERFEAYQKITDTLY